MGYKLLSVLLVLAVLQQIQGLDLIQQLKERLNTMGERREAALVPRFGKRAFDLDYDLLYGTQKRESLNLGNIIPRFGKRDYEYLSSYDLTPRFGKRVDQILQRAMDEQKLIELLSRR